MIEFLPLLIAGSVWFGLLMLQSQHQHEELMSLLNDLATMIGELFDEEQ